MLDVSNAQERLDAELARITDRTILATIRRLLVTPRCEFREWDYGFQGQAFPCWIVLEHPPSNTSIAYCEHGFGPSSPWGLLFTKGPYLSMGMDCGWYSYFEDAFRESMACDDENPEGYEVQ